MNRRHPAPPGPQPGPQRSAISMALAAACGLVPGVACAAPASGPVAGWLLGGLVAGSLATAGALAAWRRMHRPPPPAATAPSVGSQAEALLEGLPLPAFLRDAEGRFVAVNQAYAALYGCRRSDVLGQTLTQARHILGADLEPLQQAAAELDQGGARAIREFRHEATGHGARVLLLQLQPLAGDAAGLVLGTLADVTALHDARRAGEAAARATDSFLSMMSHEIRTPIAGALGIVELMAQTPLDQEQVHLLGMLEDSVDTLLHILGDILDFSRIEAGELSLDPAPCNLRALADGVLALFAPQAWEKGLRLHSIIDWRLAAEHRCDASRVRQVLANLLSNAIRFTGSGRVELRIELAEATAEGQRLRFVVSDTGPGMSEERLRQVQRPLFDGGEGIAHRTGLGLALCRQLAGLMDGSLQLASMQDEGTVATFEVLLPVVRPLLPQPDMAGRIALLCTRDRHVGQGLANALSALGFNLIEASPADLAEIGPDDAHLFVADAALVVEGRLPAGARQIRLVDPLTPLPPGLPAGGVEVQGTPLLWRATVKACHAALGLVSPEPPQAANPGPVPVPGARILVAEDHPINRAVISRQLQRLGYEHELVENGEEALQALARDRFDLLITDCHMPVLDGYALTARIRAQERGTGAHLPIIALSASVLPGQVKYCIDAGMDGFIAKPVQLHELEIQLAAHLQQAGATAARAPAPPEPPAASSSYRQLALLMETFGSMRQVREVLQRLLETSREDMDALDRSLEQGNVEQQRELLHRIGGSLRLLAGDSGTGEPPSGASNRERRDALVERLAELEELLDSLDPQATATEGGP